MARMQCYTFVLVFLTVLGHGFSAQHQKHELPVENNWPSLSEIRREANQIIASTFGAGSEMKANMPPPIQCNNSFAGSQCMPSLQCGYVPEIPEPIEGETVPQCSDSDCLLKALNDQSPMIYILNDIDISDVAPLPDITSNVTIMGTCTNGDRCKIDAKGQSGIFVIGLNGFLLLKEVDLTAGTSKEGGAIMVTGGKFVAVGVEFTNNEAHDRGGALSVKSGGAAFIHNGRFKGNKAVKGGAIYMGASEEFSKKDSSVWCGQSSCATIVGAEFMQNFAEYGGSVFVDDTNQVCAKEEGARFDCRSCTFSNNSAANDGGAVFIDYNGSGGAAIFRSSEFANNTAMGVGGDIATASGLPGAKGARFHAYKVLFYSGSRSENGSSINVRPYSFGDFTYCDFHDLQEGEDKGIQCQGTCTVSCSIVHNVSARTNQASCAEEPAPLCNWEPTNCHSFPINGTEAPIEAPISSPATAPGTTVNAPAPSPSSKAPVSSPPSPSPSSKTPISSPLSPSQIPVSSPPSFQAPGSESPGSQIPVSSPPKPSPSSPSPSPTGQAPAPSPNGTLTPAPSPSPSPTRTLTPAPSPTLTLTPASQPAVSPAPESGLPSPVPKGPKKHAPPPPGLNGSIEDAPSAPPPSSSSSSSPWSTPWCPPPHHGRRDDNGSISGDPHFVGRHGERFDFHGHPGADYCIVSDLHLHINMAFFQGLYRHRTFVSSMGMLYKQDKILLEAHAHAHPVKLEDQWKISVNDEELPKGRTIILESGLSVSHFLVSAQIQAPNEIDLNVMIMPACFGKLGSGLNYLNFKVNELKVTSHVHGVLGQTYQETSETYKRIEEAKGKSRIDASHYYIQGSQMDYVSSSILAPDCRFSSFENSTSLSKKIQRILSQTLFGMMTRDSVVKQCAGVGEPSLCL